MKNYAKEGKEVNLTDRIFEFTKNKQGHHELVELHDDDI